MTPHEIRRELEQASGLPAQALAAAVAQAAALAPDIIALLGKAVEGVHLLPKQENLLFFGLHALAAARETAACRAFVALLRRPELQLERLLGDDLTETATGLLLGLYDGVADPLFAAVEDPATSSAIKWSLFQVLARLTWEGRIPRERFLDLLDRFDREAMAPLGDLAWMGWQDAIMYLGLETFADRVRLGWEAGRADVQNEADRREWASLLRHASEHPDDPACFVGDRVEAITDPVARLAWIEPPDEAPAEDSDGPEDPAASIRLGPDELDWLADFLDSAQVPETTMSLEELDGFFTAIVAGPELILPSEYMKSIWGTEDGEGPIFDSDEQVEFFMGLLMRHWNTIAGRVEAGFPHAPVLFPATPEREAWLWAQGFIVGASLRPDAWTPLMSDENAGAFVASIFALVGDELDLGSEPPALEERREIIDALPIAPVLIRSFWHEEKTRSPRAQPVRSAKVGRNEPCPCGSGRKYKKCCGAATAPR